MLKKFRSESSVIFECKICDYKTSRKSQYNRHILTLKHEHNVKSTICQQISTEFGSKSSNFTCECGKNYKERTGLWRHKKICKTEEITLQNNNSIIENENKSLDVSYINKPITTELILDLIKDNKELKEIILQQSEFMKEQSIMISNIVKNGITNNTINNTNCINKTFNLQVFLNETCKDAMNITDFIDSIKLQLTDLIHVGEVGYVEGISNIINNKLKELDITKRPLHCTDKKRETIYIKDEGQWTKEDDNKSKLRSSIRRVSDKNIKLLAKYREKYPNCRDYDSNLSDKYSKMVIEAMGGMGNNTTEKENKIIKNISKNIIVEK